MRGLLVLVVMLVLATSVSASFGGKCNGNTLEYYDLSNTLIKRDCSILHSGQGQVFRGICKTYEGGADCFRTEGAVTPDYRDAVRGYVYNNGSVWDSPYEPTTTTLFPSVTTTTLQQCSVCAVCKTCEDCNQYKVSLGNMNMSYVLYRRNSEACSEKIKYMYSAEDYKKIQTDSDKAVSDVTNTLVVCNGDKKALTDSINTYMWAAIVSVAVLLVVVFTWLRYEWIGDPKVKNLFKVEKKRI